MEHTATMDNDTVVKPSRNVLCIIIYILSWGSGNVLNNFNVIDFIRQINVFIHEKFWIFKTKVWRIVFCKKKGPDLLFDKKVTLLGLFGCTVLYLKCIVNMTEVWWRGPLKLNCKSWENYKLHKYWFFLQPLNVSFTFWSIQ